MTILDTIQNGGRFTVGSLDKSGSIAIGFDNGNDAAKVSVLAQDGRCVSLRIPAAFSLAGQSQMGDDGIAYVVQGNDAICIGDDALRLRGDALTVGSTGARFSDPRHSQFVFSAIVETLFAAGFHAGQHRVTVCFAIPNEEFIKDGDNGNMKIDPVTREALSAHMKGKSISVCRIAPDGAKTHWDITIQRIQPSPQSMGTFTAWAQAERGAARTDFELLTILDIGSGDLQQTTIALTPFRMRTQRMGNGTIDLARGLIRAVPDAALSEPMAQNALRTGWVTLYGRRVDIRPNIHAIVAQSGARIVSQLNAAARRKDRYIVVTGGGAILLAPHIRDLFSAEGRQEGRDYRCIDSDLAVTLNSVGSLFRLFH